MSVTDVLVVGGGIAGLTAAIRVADLGHAVTVINRAESPQESNTRYAQGGIIWEDEFPESLAHDIDMAGDKIGGERASRILADEGGPFVASFLIDRLQVPFDRDSAGEIHRTAEAAHSRPRIIHVKDQTGAALQEALTREASRHPLIRIATSATAVDLITSTHHSRLRGAIYEQTAVLGAYVLSGDAVETMLASYTVLATGGLAALYAYSTNPEGARGDGFAMADRCGAHIVDMEYVQFHPTAFRREGCPAFLISEAVRGEGGILLNLAGERFMERYCPDLLELAPRDEVSRAVALEMRRTAAANVLLDLSPLRARGMDVSARFPGIHRTCLGMGVDIRTDSIPVAPAAHYTCGGIRVDGWGRSNLRNMYAVGEVSCTGLHGANRLASTSLLEGLVWGKRAAENICGNFEREDFARWEIPDWDITEVVAEPNLEWSAQMHARLREVMWENVGLVRSEETLGQAWREVSAMAIDVEEAYRHTRLTDLLVGLRNAVQAALLVITQARRNRGSRGCHYREDYPPAE
ncbi:MAG: FAD-dependent oxidoreductase [Armatimonadetes bacterium]|nr:FAD-dependent oxidoreductase [Armatimonadota bacterium]